MLTSYQASNGIYIMIMIFLTLKQILQKNYKTALDIMKFSCISYFLAGIAFKIIYVPLQIYANNEILPLKYLLIGM